MVSNWNDDLSDGSRQEQSVLTERIVRNIPVSGESSILSVKKEFSELKQFLEKHPADDDAAGWKFFCGKLAYFKVRQLEQRSFEELVLYAMQNYPGQYAANFESFLKIIEKVSFVTVACEQLLRDNRTEDALAAAKPCVACLKARTDLHSNEQLCFSSVEEAVLYVAEKGDSGENRADDHYAGFFLVYVDVLLKHVSQYGELRETEKCEIELFLDHAEKLSPCNARLWELRARTYRESDEKKYLECIRKALLYSIPDSVNDVLGDAYANLAAYYSARNYALADALCTLSCKYGGESGPVKQIISEFRYDPFPDAEIAVHQAGIQVGYSSLSRMATEKADAYRASAGMEENVDKSRKVILSASDSSYQYEVRDPITVVGRSSAMSEYLKMKPTVSRFHARLLKVDDQLFVSDMDAMNGTYVNGLRIGTQKRILQEGDELRLGSGERGARFTMKTTE